MVLFTSKPMGKVILQIAVKGVGRGTWSTHKHMEEYLQHLASGLFSIGEHREAEYSLKIVQVII